MTLRENRLSLVDIIRYDFLNWPDTDECQDAACSGFTCHSHEVLNICAVDRLLPPHVVTPVAKGDLEDAF